MQVLRTLFWVLVAVLVVVFAQANWKEVVGVTLWGGLSLDVRLPALIIILFLLGFLPTFLWYRTVRWRLRSRLHTAERELAALRAPADPVPAPVPAAGAVEPPPATTP